MSLPSHKSPLVIVAFLQNMWLFPRQVSVVSKFAPTSDERERMIRYSLFAGCTTGRRLKATLGDSLCYIIRWQEANPDVADNPRDYFPPDPVHIRAVLNKHKPQVVLCFTKAGEGVIRTMLDEGTTFIPCPHPACRRVKDTLASLKGVAKAIEALL